MTIKDDNWSILPALLLWMIKSRLDYPNGVRFASVCKNWRNASLSYPINFKDESEVNNSPPWIMSYNPEFPESTQEFTSLLTGESYTIDNPDFIHSIVLYSRQGWLLLIGPKQHDDMDTKYKSHCSVFNPFKNMNIKLPLVDFPSFHGGFTIQDGNPHCIILDSTGGYIFPCIDLYITHRGDNAWLHYRYMCVIEELSSKFWVRWTFIIGKLVYFISEKGVVFVFNVTDSQWTELIRESREQSNLTLQDEEYMVERQGGELLRVHFPQGVINKDKDLCMANCYKLKVVNNEKNAYWERIDGGVLQQTCFWFLNVPHDQSFVFETNKVDDIWTVVRLRKAWRKRLKKGINPTKKKGINPTKKKGIETTFGLCNWSDSCWVHMI